MNATAHPERAPAARGRREDALLSLPALLAACGGGGSGGSAAGGRAEGRAQLLELAAVHRHVEKTKKHPTLEEFTKQTGIKVNYFEDINVNAEYFGKIQGPLSQGEGIDRDIIVLDRQLALPRASSSTRAGRRSSTRSLIPNIANLVDAQASPPFDPNREYSLPWQSGMTGIAWNEELTGPVDVDRAALRGPEAQGQGVDAQGARATRSGSSCSRTATTRLGDRRLLQRRLDRVQAAVDSGQVVRFTGNDFAQPLTKRRPSLRRSRGRATSSSFSRTTRSSSGRSRRTAG